MKETEIIIVLSRVFELEKPVAADRTLHKRLLAQA